MTIDTRTRQKAERLAVTIDDKQHVTVMTDQQFPVGPTHYVAHPGESAGDMLRRVLSERKEATSVLSQHRVERAAETVRERVRVKAGSTARSRSGSTARGRIGAARTVHDLTLLPSLLADYTHNDNDAVDVKRLALVGQENGIDVKERWGHLSNPGLQRMNLGNVLRAKFNRGEVVHIGSVTLTK